MSVFLLLFVNCNCNSTASPSLNALLTGVARKVTAGAPPLSCVFCAFANPRAVIQPHTHTTVTAIHAIRFIPVCASFSLVAQILRVLGLLRFPSRPNDELRIPFTGSRAAKTQAILLRENPIVRVPLARINYRRPRAPFLAGGFGGGWNSASLMGTFVFTDFTVSVNPLPPAHHSVRNGISTSPSF